ncbi:MAG: hypothetical protein NXI00_14135 [Cytophagales bacterium]|nr:hypothetical protein [Cytophagales bacterium]
MKKVFKFALFLLVCTKGFTQIYGLDSNFVINSKPNFTPLKIYELNDSTFFVGLQKSKSSYYPLLTSFSLGDFQAIAGYSTKGESLFLQDFTSSNSLDNRVSYLGRFDDNLVFINYNSIFTYSFNKRKLNEQSIKAISFPLLYYDSHSQELFYHDTLKNSIISQNLLTGEILTKYKLPQDSNGKVIAFASGMNGKLLTVKQDYPLSYEAVFFDNQFSEIASRSLGLTFQLPPYSLLPHKLIEKKGEDSFILEVTTSGEGGTYYNYFEVNLKSEKKIHSGLSFRPIKQTKDSILFLEKSQVSYSSEGERILKKMWKSLDNETEIRTNLEDFEKIGTDYFGIKEGEIRKLIDGYIFFDFTSFPETPFDYLSKYYILNYHTNSSYRPHFELNGPGIISNDTIFFSSSGTILLKAFPEENPMVERTKISININKSSPNFHIKNCGNNTFWLYENELPLDFPIELNNPFDLNTKIEIEGGEGYYKNDTFNINSIIESFVTIKIRTEEDERFLQSAEHDCNYYFALPAPKESNAYIYPNPVNRKTFFVRLPFHSDHTPNPDFKIFDIEGKSVEFKKFTVDPYNYEFYIPNANQKVYFLKSSNFNESLRLIFSP